MNQKVISKKQVHCILQHYGYLLLQQCCGSMTFWCVSGPDPVIYVIEQKTSYFFKRIFSLLFFEGTFASFFGDKESKTMTKL